MTFHTNFLLFFCDLLKFTGNASNDDFLLLLASVRLFIYCSFLQSAILRGAGSSPFQLLRLSSETVSVTMLQEEQYLGKCDIILMRSGCFFHALLVQLVFRTRGMRNLQVTCDRTCRFLTFWERVTRKQLK